MTNIPALREAVEEYEVAVRGNYPRSDLIRAANKVADALPALLDEVEAARQYKNDILKALTVVTDSDALNRPEHITVRNIAMKRRALLDEVERLRADQRDWRKGVELIASGLGEKNPTDLCCVRLSEVAMKLRAALEADHDL